MKTYYIYLLECSDGSYYIGITNNLQKRLWEHESAHDEDAYTFSRRPVVLKWFEEFTNVHHAIETEKQLKRWSRRKKQALIERDWEKLSTFSRNYTQFGN